MPLSWERCLVTCLLHRAYLYSSNDSLLKTEINSTIFLFKRNCNQISFIINVIHKFENKLTTITDYSPPDLPSNTSNLYHYLSLPYIGTLSIKSGKSIAVLFSDRLGTDIKITYHTFKIVSYFYLKVFLPSLFCSNVVYKYTCSCDKSTSYIGMTTRRLFLRTKNHLSNNQSSSQPQPSNLMGSVQSLQRNSASRAKLHFVEKCRLNTEAELMEALLNASSS